MIAGRETRFEIGHILHIIINNLVTCLRHMGRRKDEAKKKKKKRKSQ
jgi:hypothetical protein